MKELRSLTKRLTSAVQAVVLCGIVLTTACSAPVTPLPEAPVAVTPPPATSTESGEDRGEELISPVEWFAPSAALNAGWQVSLAPDQAGVVLLEPKDNVPQYRLFFLLTRGHKLFDRAIEVVLTTFYDRGIFVAAAVSLVMNPETKTIDPDKALAAIAYAESNDYDLIYPVGSDATAFLHNNYQGGRLPVVALLAKDPVLLGQIQSYEQGSGTNIAYTSVSVPVEVQMVYFQQLIPELKNIVIVYDQNNTSTLKTQVTPLAEYAMENGFMIFHLAVLQVEDPETTRQELLELFPPIMNRLRHDDPMNEQSMFLLTNSGTIVEVFDTVVTLAGDIPVVSLLPDLVREGKDSAVLSVGVSFDSNSVLAAVYGIRILQDGVSPGSLPVGVITPPDIAINFLKAREINLRIPFSLFESAAYVYDAQGKLVRAKGQTLP